MKAPAGRTKCFFRSSLDSVKVDANENPVVAVKNTTNTNASVNADAATDYGKTKFVGHSNSSNINTIKIEMLPNNRKKQN